MKFGLLTTDKDLFYLISEFTHINYVTSHPFDANGLIPTDRDEYDFYIEVTPLNVSLLLKSEINRTCLSIKAIDFNDYNNLKGSGRFWSYMLNYYNLKPEVNVSDVKYPFDDIINVFEVETIKDYYRRCFEKIKSENIFRLDINYKIVSSSIVLCNGNMCEAYDAVDKLYFDKSLLEMDTLISNLISNSISNVIVSPPSNDFDHLLYLNFMEKESEEDRNTCDFDGWQELGEQEMRNMDDEDPTWRIANDLD
jgi:hypothetical protein